MTRRIVAPDWYAEKIGRPLVSHTDAIAGMPRAIGWAATRIGPIRGLSLAWASRGGVLAVIKGLPGSATALVACALSGRRPRVVVLEFISRPVAGSRSRKLLREFAQRFIEAPAMRRGMAAGQTLTSWERAEYAKGYGVAADRFAAIRWPLCRTGKGPVAPIAEVGSRVLSSGRAGSDWATLLDARKDAPWSLTVICAETDAERVRRLAGGNTDVHSELSRARHDELLRESDVYVMSMQELGVSAGHVRLMSAVEAGVPVIASDVRALGEYVVAGETALIVPIGDSAALRRSVDSLLEDQDTRVGLRDAALARAKEWTYEHYFDQVRALILGAAAS